MTLPFLVLPNSCGDNTNGLTCYSYLLLYLVYQRHHSGAFGQNKRQVVNYNRGGTGHARPYNIQGNIRVTGLVENFQGVEQECQQQGYPGKVN